MLWAKCFYWFSIFLPVFCVIYEEYSPERDVYSHQNKFTKTDLIIGLKKALEYLAENVEQLDEDTIFGVLLAYKQLEKLKDTENKQLGALLTISKYIIFKYQTSDKKNNEDGFYAKVSKGILDPLLWEDESFEINKSLTCKIDGNTNFLSPINLPNEEESDQCISELFEQASFLKNVSNENHHCSMSKFCQDKLIKNSSWGYGLTHRILYFIIAKAEKCKFDISLDNICCSIFHELNLMKTMKYPESMKDLFVEELVLCSLSGYKAFLKDEWIFQVLEWQRSEGCWGLEIPLQFHPENTKVKRSTKPLGKAMCSSHSTAVGVAYLAIASRKYFH